MEHPAWSSLVSLGVGAGQACWGAPAADQPPCADHVCKKKKGLVQGRLWVEGCICTSILLHLKWRVGGFQKIFSLSFRDFSLW